MEFHHFNPDAKDFAITDAIAYRKPPSSIKSEMEKCLPVCANCHRIIHIECVI
jgi:predicted HNH restriction endonuclease